MQNAKCKMQNKAGGEVILETERLLFRKFTIDDAELIYDLNFDPEVTKYTKDPITDVGHARKVLEEVILPQYALYGHGRWALLLKENGEFIGWCGLKYRPELDEIDLGYRFKKKFWGKGYATEAAKASIDYGFGKLNLKTITGRALPGNDASVKVLEKCGMKYIGIQNVDGYDRITYQIIKD
jgi:[ribosomal protein S5]-alanine N-acetyltransferase